MFLKIQKCFDPAAGPFVNYVGIFTLTAPNGKDSLTGTYTGKNTKSGGRIRLQYLQWRSEDHGGNRQFDNAQGHARFTAVGHGSNATAFYAVEGLVSSRGD